MANLGYFGFHVCFSPNLVWSLEPSTKLDENEKRLTCLDEYTNQSQLVIRIKNSDCFFCST